MPIRHAIIHLIDKKPDGNPAVLHISEGELADSPARDNLLADLNEAYNAKPNKAWGLFIEESGAYPFSRWLKDYLVNELRRNGLSIDTPNQYKQEPLPFVPCKGQLMFFETDAAPSDEAKPS